MSGTFHFPSDSNVHVYRSWRWSSPSVHWAQDTREAQRNCRLANTSFLSWKALHALSCRWFSADPVSGSQNQIMSWGGSRVTFPQPRKSELQGGRKAKSLRHHWPGTTLLRIYTHVWGFLLRKNRQLPVGHPSGQYSLPKNESWTQS